MPEHIAQPFEIARAQLLVAEVRGAAYGGEADEVGHVPLSVRVVMDFEGGRLADQAADKARADYLSGGAAWGHVDSLGAVDGLL